MARIYDAEDGIEALQLYLKYKPDLILLDFMMPKLDGSKVLEAITKNDLDTRVIMTSAWKDDQITINDLMKKGAFSFVPKPMNRMILMKSITDALYQSTLAKNTDKSSKKILSNTNY